MLRAIYIQALVFLATAVLTSVSCSDDSETTSPRSDTQIPQPTLAESQSEATPNPIDTIDEPTPEPLIIGEGRPPTAHARSVEAMLKAYPLVVVGEISGVIAPYDPRPGVLGLPDAPSVLPTLKSGATIDPAALDRPPARLWTDYSLTVLEVVAGDGVKPGDVLRYTQIGGLCEGRAHQSAHDPLVRQGERYLLFLEYDSEQDNYTAMPFARYEIDGSGDLQIADQVWLYLSVPQTLHDKSLEESKASVRNVADRQ